MEPFLEMTKDITSDMTFKVAQIGIKWWDAIDESIAPGCHLEIKVPVQLQFFIDEEVDLHKYMPRMLFEAMFPGEEFEDRFRDYM